jgi:hypothetical protein
MTNDTIFVLVDGDVIATGSADQASAVAQTYACDDDDSWGIVFTDANDGPERVLYEHWTDERGRHIAVAHGDEGLAAALTA